MEKAKEREDQSRGEVDDLKRENEKAFYLLEAMKRESENLL